MIEKDREARESNGYFLSREELQSLVSFELRYLDSFTLKDAMMHRIKDTLDEVVDLGFLATDTGNKHALFCFLKKALVGIVRHGIMYELTGCGFVGWNHSKILKEMLVGRMSKFPNLAQQVLQVPKFNECREI